MQYTFTSLIFQECVITFMTFQILVITADQMAHAMMTQDTLQLALPLKFIVLLLSYFSIFHSFLCHGLLMIWWCSMSLTTLAFMYPWLIQICPLHDSSHTWPLQAPSAVNVTQT